MPIGLEKRQYNNDNNNSNNNNILQTDWKQANLMLKYCT